MKTKEVVIRLRFEDPVSIERYDEDALTTMVQENFKEVTGQYPEVIFEEEEKNEK